MRAPRRARRRTLSLLAVALVVMGLSPVVPAVAAPGPSAFAPGIYGTIHASDNSGVAGLTVELWDYYATQVVATSTTDSFGQYEFVAPSLPWGGPLRVTDPLHRFPDGWWSGEDKLTPNRTNLTPTAMIDTNDPIIAVDLKILRTASVRGVVTDGHGAPANGIEVDASAFNTTVASVVTGPDGRFSFPGLTPGTYWFGLRDTKGAGPVDELFEQGSFGLTEPYLFQPYVIAESEDRDLGSHPMAKSACGSAEHYPMAGHDLSACVLLHWDDWPADLHGNDMRGADLYGAHARSVSFVGANLAGADLRHADLLLANLTNADLTGAIWGSTICPDGVVSDAAGGTCAGHRTSPVPGGEPLGVIDAITPVLGTTTITGWTIDPDYVNPIRVKMLVDGQDLWPEQTASLDRPGLAATYPLHGIRHGFSFDVGTLRPGPHTICVQARDRRDVGYMMKELGCQTVSWPLQPAEYVPITPTRLLDTRNGPGKIGPGGSMELVVNDHPWMQGHVGAVVLNVTVTNATAASHLTVWPSGEARPVASNLNFVAGQTVPNLVVVKVGAGGRIKIFNNSGSTDVIADLSGFFTDGTTDYLHGRFHATSPLRAIDTRESSLGKLGPGEVLQLQLRDEDGQPLRTVEALALNVTVTDPSAPSHVSVFPGDLSELPTVSNLNFTTGQTVANMVIVRLSADGRFYVYNHSGSTHVIVDVEGAFDSTTPVTRGAEFHTLSPQRVLDTRSGVGGPAQAIGPAEARTLIVAGSGGVPATGASAVVLNVTATDATTASHLTLWPSSLPQPVASNLNLRQGQTVPNLVVVPLSSRGAINIFNNAGSIQVIADVAGYFDLGPGTSPAADGLDATRSSAGWSATATRRSADSLAAG